MKGKLIMMKKVFLTLVMLFTMGMYSFAENNEATEMESVEKYEFNINKRKLACFLELSSDQMESVEQITEEFERGMMFAFYENKNDSRYKVTDNVIKMNIKHMSYILTKEQYHKYLMVLNATLINKGFIKE